MPQAWSDKRERQYEHIKQSQEERGTGDKRAKEIAARTVNKNRAQSGEARESSRSSRRGPSPQQRGGKRSGGSSRQGGRTRDQLYEEAKRRDIPGRSNMTKSELEKALNAR